MTQTWRKRPSFVNTSAFWVLFLGPIIVQVSIAVGISLAAAPVVFSTWLDWTWAALNFIWFAPIVWAVANFLGLIEGPPAELAPGQPARRSRVLATRTAATPVAAGPVDPLIESPSDEEMPSSKTEDIVPRPSHPAEPLLIIAWVSRGQNQIALKRAMSRTQAVLEAIGIVYELEAVTDIPVEPYNRLQPAAGLVHYEQVPPNYQTPTRVKYKARALQYLLERRAERLDSETYQAWLTHDVWVMHCDEESTLTPDLVQGMLDFMEKHSSEATSGNMAIGQGEILYNAHNYGENTLLTAMDAVRTGDDLGRFRFQYGMLRKPIFGMHGSFVLVPEHIERQITWDNGACSNITEDSYFALKAMEQGIPFDWVHGTLREQSPFTISDIIKQRTRWYTGLGLITLDNRLKFSSRFMLGVFVASWTISWLGCLLSLVRLFTLVSFGEYMPMWAVVTTATITGIIGAVYLVGAWRNVSTVAISNGKRVRIMASTYLLLLIGIVPLVEAAAVVYALYRAVFNPLDSFVVVEKN